MQALSSRILVSKGQTWLIWDMTAQPRTYSKFVIIIILVRSKSKIPHPTKSKTIAPIKTWLAKSRQQPNKKETHLSRCSKNRSMVARRTLTTSHHASVLICSAVTTTSHQKVKFNRMAKLKNQACVSKKVRNFQLLTYLNSQTLIDQLVKRPIQLLASID